MIRITLECWSNTHHLQQAYLGFSWLARLGYIDLDQEISSPNKYYVSGSVQHLHNHQMGCFIAHINNGPSVCFDMHDSYEIHPLLSKITDVYVKRSYLKSEAIAIPEGKRCIPYGPFYEVYSNHFDQYLLKRTIGINMEWKRRFRSLIRSWPVLDLFMSCPREKLLTFEPLLTKDPKIIFSVNIHDPHDDPKRPQEQVEKRIALIEQRAELVRGLKKEYGSRFHGGLKDNHVARKYAPDCILENPSAFSKKNYINTVKSCSIGLSTTGLHNSIGGKFGEYIAMSKCIVSSPLDYYQGEGLEEGRHYLKANTSQDFLQSVAQLTDSEQSRYEMQKANNTFYNNRLRPDRKIANILDQVT